MVMRSCLVLFVAVLCLALPIHASRRPQAQPAAQFRSGVELVQIDVSVLDRDRRPVRGLKSDDFTIVEDGKAYPVAAFAEVVVPDAEEPPASWMRDIAPEVRRNDENQDRRLTVVVLDDMTIPFDAQFISSAKDIGRKIVAEMGAADLVAVVFTRSNREAQDFTADRARLLGAIDKFSPGARDLHPQEETLQEHYFISALSTLRRAAEFLAAVPQRRKTLVYVSTGIPFDPEAAAEIVLARPRADGEMISPIARQNLHTRLRHELEGVFREAQRANINIYSVDPSGLGGMERAVQQSLALGSAFGPVPPEQRLQVASRQSTLHADMLRTVADNTGGRAFLNTNEFGTAVVQIFRENSSYYLLGHRPVQARREGSFTRIEVKVNRPDVEVRARNGYYTPRNDARSMDSAASELNKALAGLLPKGDIAMQVSAAPMLKPGSNESTVAIVLGLREPSPGGSTRLMTDVNLSVNAYSPEGQPRGSHRLTASLTLRPAAGTDAEYEVLSQIDLRPGRYQLRLAAESTLQSKTGSVFYDVEVPDFTRLPLSMSGVVMSVDPRLPAAPRDRLKTLLPVQPTTARDFFSRDKVSAFFRIYQPRSPTPVTLHARVMDSRNRIVFGTPETIAAGRFLQSRPAEPEMALSGRGRTGPPTPRSDPAPVGPYTADVRLDLPVYTFSPGPYVLTIEVTSGRQSARRDVRFQMH